MNKKLLEAFSQAGVAFEKNRGYGVVNGFETNVKYGTVAPIIIHFACYATDEQKRTILKALAAEKIAFANFLFDKFGLGLLINDWTGGTLAKRLSTVFEKICNVLTSNGALGVGYCPVCGNALDYENCKKCIIDGMSISIDNTCVDNINGQIDAENKLMDEAPNNYVRGFAGAFLGGLVGAALSVLFYYIGFISALSAFVAFIVGELLYRKFGGKPNKVMVLIICCTVFSMMITSVLGTYLVAAAMGAAEVGMDTMEYFQLCMQDEEISLSFATDMILTILFTALGCGFEIYLLRKRMSRQKNI